MSTPKALYVCNECGANAQKWAGQCSHCGAWNSITEETVSSSLSLRHLNTDRCSVSLLSDITVTPDIRCQTHYEELNRVLGGGIVKGSVVLMGGEPGVGKSTLLLQMLCHMQSQPANALKALYVTGEESLQQVTLRSRRLELPQTPLGLLAETQLERILATLQSERPSVVVIDSIQTMWSEALSSAPGSVSQVRECTAQLVQFAKQTEMALFLIGHVTKEGTLAGPRILEHMVDVVLYFEGDSQQRYRLIRSVKNRYGTVNELGIFAMTDKGLREVNNPSALFLSHHDEAVPGSLTTVTWEGSRPLLVEIQSLVDETQWTNPRRLTVGLDANRLAMLLAVLHRHHNIATDRQNVFVNVVGGVRVVETSADLPMILSILSSLKNTPLPRDLIVFGEIGLAGEVRPVQSGQERLKEASKQGFRKAIIPKANVPKKALEDIEVIGVKDLREAIKALE